MQTLPVPVVRFYQRSPEIALGNHKNSARMAAMPWNRRRARLNEIQLQRTNGALSTQLVQVREQLKNKECYAAGLEILLRQRNERIDQLTAQVDQLREHSRHADEKAEHMAMFVGLMLDLNDAVAAKQAVACVIGSTAMA